MNGDIYRLREEMLERLAALTERITDTETGLDLHGKLLLQGHGGIGRELSERITALEATVQRIEEGYIVLASKCQCNNKATPTAVKELRSALPG